MADVSRLRDDPIAQAAAMMHHRRVIFEQVQRTMRGVSQNMKAKQQDPTALPVPSVVISGSASGTLSLESQSEVGQTPISSPYTGTSSFAHSCSEATGPGAIGDMPHNASLTPPVGSRPGVMRSAEKRTQDGGVVHRQPGLETLPGVGTVGIYGGGSSQEIGGNTLPDMGPEASSGIGDVFINAGGEDWGAEHFDGELFSRLLRVPPDSQG